LKGGVAISEKRRGVEDKDLSNSTSVCLKNDKRDTVVVSGQNRPGEIYIARKKKKKGKGNGHAVVKKKRAQRGGGLQC